jgi:hypothetical protein
MTFDSTEKEQTVVLKSTMPYSGIRITMTHTLDADGSLADITAGILSQVSSIVLDQPKHGSRSQRVNLSGDAVHTLPFICQLSAGNAVDAASATSVKLQNLDDESNVGIAYFDLPAFQTAEDPDVRITIKASAAASSTLKVSFAFLDRAFKDVYFRAYDINSTASHQQFFPSEGRLRGVVVASHTSSNIDARNNEITQISLNGEQLYTYTDPQLLAANYDQVVLGGAKTAAFALDVYAMLENFPVLPQAANYVQVDRSAASDMYVLGVMSDA